MGQVTVFSGPERRRRWSDEERLQRCCQTNYNLSPIGGAMARSS